MSVIKEPTSSHGLLSPIQHLVIGYPPFKGFSEYRQRGIGMGKFGYVIKVDFVFATL
jgi:hypothetical protein